MDSAALWVTFGMTLFGVVAGGLITGCFSRLYYVRASKDLKQETEELRRQGDALIQASKGLEQESKELRRQGNVLLRALEEAGLIRVEWRDDRAFAIVAGSVRIAAGATIQAITDSATLSESSHIERS